MPEALRDPAQEYWRPVRPTMAPSASPILAKSLCEHCGAEYAIGARYCHVCGADRNPEPAGRSFAWFQIFDLDLFRQRMGLGIASLVFLILGLTCMVATALTGVVYTARNLVDWEAVQIWRVQWLLAAIAAFLVGILLRKKES